MCASPVCVAWIESTAAKLLTQLPATTEGTQAKDFIRATTGRMRCGCTGVEKPCFAPEVTGAMIAPDGRTLIEEKACTADGNLWLCARSYVNCDGLPIPVCVKPCTGQNIITVKFRLKNLDWMCFEKEVEPLDKLREDVVVNVVGLLKSDIICACTALAAGGTECTCNVVCGALARLRDINLEASFNRLRLHAEVLVVPTPTLDKSTRCKVTVGPESFGTSFEFVSIETNFPEEAAQAASASSLVVGLPIALAIGLGL
jgi:hypothetical protein